MRPSRDIQQLLAIMSALRDPVNGCPWDIEQSFETIVPYTIEEAYEVADAVQRKDYTDLTDELGDLLLQVVFHAQIAAEEKQFDFGDVVEAITTKMIRRHPHVFGAEKGLSPEAVAAQWQAIKSQEKRFKAERGSLKPTGLLSDIPPTLPAMTRALKLQQKAGTVGFDWQDALQVLAKLKEEIAEVEQAIEQDQPKEIEAEIGDLFFALVNLARHYKIDPESSLRLTNAKFERRFGYIEAVLAKSYKTPAQATLAEMDALWNQAKLRAR